MDKLDKLEAAIVAARDQLQAVANSALAAVSSLDLLHETVTEVARFIATVAGKQDEQAQILQGLTADMERVKKHLGL